MVVLMVACSDAPDAPEGVEQGDVRMKITITMPPSTRASDVNHEDESPVNRENAVEEMTVLIYDDADGLNGNPATSIRYASHLTSSQFTQNDNRVTVRYTLSGAANLEGMRVIALINMGDQSHLATLGDVQRLKPLNSFSQDKSTMDGYHAFAMANALDTDGVISKLPSDNDRVVEYDASLSVQRVAARIDYHWTDEQQVDYENEWVKYETINDLGTVYVTHVMPVNAMQRPSFALQHTSLGLSPDKSCLDSWRYCKHLECDANQRPTCYVVEPHSSLKATSSAALLQSWYGTSTADLILEQRHDHFTAEGVKKLIDYINDGTADPLRGMPADEKDAKEHVRILYYVNENTQHVTDTRAESLTGLVIRAIYVPRNVYVDEYFKEKAETYVGMDLYRYTPQIETTTEHDVLYFSNEDAAEAYSLLHPEDYAEIKYFPGGVCYYSMWLRHVVNDNGSLTFPMEYAVVRNHVYRVSFNFRGIGREGIKIEEPDNVEVTIVVRPWRMFPTHDMIIM